MKHKNNPLKFKINLSKYQMENLINKECRPLWNVQAFNTLDISSDITLNTDFKLL